VPVHANLANVRFPDAPDSSPRTSSMSRRSSCCFLGVAEGVDDGVDAGGEVVCVAAELIVAGERDSFLIEAGSLVLQLFSA
jgi:hypothetical protein